MGRHRILSRTGDDPRITAMLWFMITILRSAPSAAGSRGSRASLSCLPGRLLGIGILVGWFMLEDLPAQATATTFTICKSTPYENCVVDGDTFYLGRDPIRIADIDAPEMHPSRCP